MNTRLLTILLSVLLLASCKDKPTCDDGIQNGGEMGTDCGGECTNVCTPRFVEFNTVNSGLNYSNVTEVESDGAVSLWLRLGNETTGSGIAYFIPDSIWVYHNTANTNLSSNNLWDIMDGVGDTVWACPSNGGLSAFDGTAWTSWTTGNSTIPGDNVVEMVQDPSTGGMWLACDGAGIAYFNGTTFTTYNVANSHLTSNNVTCVDVDGAGNVWIGTSDSGVVMFDQDTTFLNYRVITTGGLSSDNISKVAVERYGKVWVGTAGGGVSSFNGNVWQKFSSTSSGLASNNVENIFLEEAIGEDPVIWIGGTCSFSRWGDNRWTYLDGGGFVGLCPQDIYITPSGRHWVATSQGLTRFE